MSADALSDVLKTVRLTGATFFDVVAREPWVAESPPNQLILSKILPGAEHLIAYHVITDGSVYTNLVGGAPMAVKAGEVIIYARGDAHVLSSAAGMRADPCAATPLDLAADFPLRLSYGSGSAVSAKFVCGFLACDARPFNPLIDSLPPLIKIGDGDGEAPSLGQFVKLAMAEAAEKRAGSETVLAKLSELMFIEAVRRHIAALPEEQSGWLAGLRDPLIGKALAHLHAAPARDWTIEMLAKEVGSSRSVLAERFASLLGMPPMQYLGKWRMQIAAGLLASGNANIARIAAETGYGSEAAFSRAFKKIVGVPPSAWRRGAEAGASD